MIPIRNVVPSSALKMIVLTPHFVFPILAVKKNYLDISECLGCDLGIGDCQLTSPRQGPSSSPIQKGRGELLLRLLLKSQFSNKENPDKDIRPNWASSRCWIIFLSQAFRPCQIFHMTPRKLLRCVTTFSVGNFWKKSIFCPFLGLKNGFLTRLKVWFGV